MRIFVYEWICGGGPVLDAGSTPEVLRELLGEGFAMLDSIVEDFLRIYEVDEVVTIVSRTSLAALGPVMLERPGVTVREVSCPSTSPGVPLEDLFDTSVADCDATLVIAPEFDQQLLSWTQRVLDRGGRLLGCDPEAVRLTADKLATASHLRACGLPTPRVRSVPTDTTTGLPGWVDTLRLPWVIKPRFGAGCGHTRLVRTARDATRVLEDRLDPVTLAEDSVIENAVPELVATEYVPGVSASVSCLVGSGRLDILTPGLQKITTSSTGHMRYEGGEIPLLPDAWNERACSLAKRTLETITGLRGFVGVDLVLGDAEDGSGDSVMEVNPRVTSSYPLLARYDRTRNLAWEWLNLQASVQPERPPA